MSNEVEAEKVPKRRRPQWVWTLSGVSFFVVLLVVLSVTMSGGMGSALLVVAGLTLVLAIITSAIGMYAVAQEQSVGPYDSGGHTD